MWCNRSICQGQQYTLVLLEHIIIVANNVFLRYDVTTDVMLNCYMWISYQVEPI
jgi:hypothetical protein